MILILGQPFDWMAPPGFGARASCRVAVDCQLYPTDHGMPSPGRSAQIVPEKRTSLVPKQFSACVRFSQSQKQGMIFN